MIWLQILEHRNNKRGFIRWCQTKCNETLLSTVGDISACVSLLGASPGVFKNLCQHPVAPKIVS